VTTQSWHAGPRTTQASQSIVVVMSQTLPGATDTRDVLGESARQAWLAGLRDDLDRIVASTPATRHRLDPFRGHLGFIHPVISRQIEVPKLCRTPRHGDVEAGEISASATAPPLTSGLERVNHRPRVVPALRRVW
jgi:hypothetical protein